MPETPLSLYDLLRRHADATPDAPAILAPQRAALDYRGLFDRAESVARSLAGLGVAGGDRVAVVLPNGPEMAVCFLGVAAVAYCAPLNPDDRESGFDRYVDDSQQNERHAEA